MPSQETALFTTVQSGISTVSMNCPNFVAFVRYYDPSHHYGSLKTGRLLNSTMVSINAPTRIGHVMVMPGDVVLGRNGGVIFIPPQLAEQVVKILRRNPLARCFWTQAACKKGSTRLARSIPAGPMQSNRIITNG